MTQSSPSWDAATSGSAALIGVAPTPKPKYPMPVRKRVPRDDAEQPPAPYHQYPPDGRSGAILERRETKGATIYTAIPAPERNDDEDNSQMDIEVRVHTRPPEGHK
mgnify:CR=1 FL=1